ncbi:sulfotransferase [Paraburkholderia sp. DHOC27]|uniref:sulfotransferase family protein n=1 Tax=Paraburkholderia sp. DHOC27 TaxID=2303330 RepID=UPI000E3CCC54|nr:sulfotransferase [Paraburkholderia sp. DHOC27]RFU45635.1 sulfotransferase [Paraburkholderia sp. DHOC27]
MQSSPLFIVGAPRSGTTFLCSLLNTHPLIELTNECRIFVLLKHLLEVESQRPDLLGAMHRERFEAFGRRTLGAWVERYYREALEIAAPIWGDKHPAYGDPTVLSGRTGSVERMPHSGSCLLLIREALPHARFIHIHRDPRDVAHSLLHKRWAASLEDGVRVWSQYVDEIMGFFADLPPAQKLTLPYRHLVEDGSATVATIGDFLGLADASPISEFLATQRHAPTPFSDPVTDIADLYLVPAARAGSDAVLDLAGEAAAMLGYAAA